MSMRRALSQLSIKRGDTLALDCVVAADLAGWRVRSQIRASNDRLLAECVVSALAYDAEAKVTHYAITVDAAVTRTWPMPVAPRRTYPAVMDIEYTDPAGVVQSTETVALEIERDVTRPVVA